MPASECCQHTFGSNGIETPESGTALQFRKRHFKQQLGYTFIGKRIADYINSRKIKHDTFILLYQRKQLLTHTFTQRTRPQVLTKFSKTECYHNSFNSLSFKNTSLYCSATFVRLATTSAGLISLFVRSHFLPLTNLFTKKTRK